MAVGDVITAIVSVPAGATATYQPAAGVEVMITEAGTCEEITIRIGLTDGTNSTYIAFAMLNCSYDSTYGERIGERKIFINDSVYLMIENSDTVDHIVMYCGIQTK